MEEKCFENKKDLEINPLDYDVFIENVPAINQFSEYPVGCEAIALLQLLKYNGADVDAEAVVNLLKKGDLPYQEGNVWYGGDPEIEFVGDPRNPGYGVYDKPIEDVANEFKKGIKNVTGSSLDEVLKLVKKGYPVQVWVTIELLESEISKTWIHKESGQTIKWKKNLHSLVVVGYSKDYVVVADPYVGKIRSFDRKKFEERYNYLGKRALYYE